MEVNNSLQNIFHEVAGVKLADLKKQRSAILDHFQPILESVNKSEASQNQHETLQVLTNAIRTGPQFHDTSSFIQELDVFLANSADNPTTHSALLEVWIRRVKNEIHHSVRKAKYSNLYGTLIEDWMTHNNKAKKVTSPTPALTPADEEEKVRTIAQLGQKIFTKPTEFNKEKFDEFLRKELFNFESNSKAKEIFEKLVEQTKTFSKLEHFVVTKEVTVATIKGLYSKNLFRKEKQEALLDLVRNQDAIIEITGILSDRLRNFAQWAWPGQVRVEMVRGITGPFRAYMDEDTLTALFLQLIGVLWGSHFKSILRNFYESEIWIRPVLVDENGKDYKYRNSIQMQRKNFHNGCFLTTLPSDMHNQSQNPYDNEDEENSTTLNPLVMKSRIVHVINTEVKLNQIVNPDGPLIVVQSDMEWFGPSLVHEAILTILKFFGVSEDWLKFFERFLRAPLDFDGTVRVRERGVPIAHTLSAVFGEINLFLLDVVVNKTSGENLYRLYDDLWFWGRDPEKIVAAWRGIQELSAMVGLAVNLQKSGSVITGSAKYMAEAERKDANEDLPQTPVRWGFLKLDPRNGFQIDPESFTPFVGKMTLLLERAPSVLDWMNVYNKYMKFFIRNCGRPARVLGAEYLSRLIRTLKDIHAQHFIEGSPVRSIKSKFPDLMTDIVDSWTYWPLASGGLGLFNPFLELLPLLDAYKDKKDDANFDLMPQEDMRAWERKTKSMEIKNAKLPEQQKKVPPTFEEYCKDRESQNSDWGSRYSNLMESLNPKTPPPPNNTAFSSTHGSGLTPGDARREAWLNSTFGPEIREHFGTNCIVDPKFIPVTLVSLLEKQKITT